MSEVSINLPRRVGIWTPSGTPQIVDPQDIFSYMDGAGELYLGYRFKHLEVQRYSSSDQGEILVELYWMESSDDAYGLLSGDWGGEPVDIFPAQQPRSPAVNDGPRALYGAGLLRLWSDNLYARVMAERETDASKAAVHALGQAITTGRPMPQRPALIRALPDRVGSRFFLRPERVTFLRSHLVLNSVYFLSSENLLNLGRDCEMAATTYGQGSAQTSGKSKPARVLVARYANEAAAVKALRHFEEIYIPEKSNDHRPAVVADSGVIAIEDGWLGFARSGRGLVFVFESPDEKSARLFLGDFLRILEKLEGSRD